MIFRKLLFLLVMNMGAGLHVSVCRGHDMFHKDALGATAGAVVTAVCLRDIERGYVTLTASTLAGCSAGVTISSGHAQANIGTVVGVVAGGVGGYCWSNEKHGWVKETMCCAAIGGLLMGVAYNRVVH